MITSNQRDHQTARGVEIRRGMIAEAISAWVHSMCASFCTSSQSITIFGLPALPFCLPSSAGAFCLTAGTLSRRSSYTLPAPLSGSLPRLAKDVARVREDKGGEGIPHQEVLKEFGLD